MAIATHPEERNPFPLTDLGNAERFAFMHADRVRFVPKWGTWLVWDGRRWERDELRKVERLAWATVRAIVDEANARDDSDDRLTTYKFAMKSEGQPRIRAMLSLAENHERLVVNHEDLDREPWLLTVENGTLDLRMGTLREHRREDLITRLAPITYDPEATCPRWNSFLARVLNGRDELVAFLQRAVGYSLTGDTSEQCLFFLHGVGQNGKSTFLEIVRALLGEYATQADFATFLERKQEGPRNDIARLEAARLVTSSEAGEGRRLNESLVKSLTGGDMIAARYLFREAFEFRPQFKLWLAANHKPVIRDTTVSIWRRIKLVPFTVQIPDTERDDRLIDALREELPGILRWALEGCQVWLEGGLRAPEDVLVATEKYRSESDLLGAFLSDCCVLDPNASEPATALYQHYRKWAEEAGEFIVSQTKFGRQLEERGITSAKLGTGEKRLKFRLGIRLLNGDLRPSGSVGDSPHPISGNSLYTNPSYGKDMGNRVPTIPEPSQDLFDDYPESDPRNELN